MNLDRLICLDDSEDPLLSVPETAARAGVEEGTWRSYVSRGRAPEPDDPGNMDESKFRRRPRWRASTADAFREGRLGQGSRTDLVKDRAAQRKRIEEELSEPPPAPTPAMNDWLAANHRAVLQVAEALTDHREQLLAAAHQHEILAEAIDAAGQHISARPSRQLANAVAYALFLLGPDGPILLPADSEVREVLVRHRRLHDEFDQLRNRK